MKAPVVFPNNDVKYDVNKRRARRFAHSRGEAITWVQAKDKPSLDTLRERPNAAAEKLRWLTYHDQDCNKLYGMLPLVRGMPVALTDHIDRNPKKLLLRGKVGYVHSWVEHPEEDSTFKETTAYSGILLP